MCCLQVEIQRTEFASMKELSGQDLVEVRVDLEHASTV